MHSVQSTPPQQTRSVSLRILGLHIRVACPDPALREIVVLNFGAMVAADESPPADLEYRVSTHETQTSIALIRAGEPALAADTPGDFLYLLEKDITVELQKRRPDLFFLHSAAVDWNGECYLLAAESGSGKSTTTWGLLHHGFRYLSDELSPVDLDSMMVFPYPHALCLKQLPAADYRLPDAALRLGRTIHVPAQALPGAPVIGPRPLRGVLLVKHCPDLRRPTMRPISSAEAGARLYVAALNALAHANRGLDAAVSIAERVPCFAVSTGDLAMTCGLIRSRIERMAAEFIAEECRPG